VTALFHGIVVPVSLEGIVEIVYVAELAELVVIPLLVAITFSVRVSLTVTGAVYFMEEIVGVLPSVV
jgi:hypothetical protein